MVGEPRPAAHEGRAIRTGAGPLDGAAVGGGATVVVVEGGAASKRVLGSAKGIPPYNELVCDRLAAGATAVGSGVEVLCTAGGAVVSRATKDEVVVEVDDSGAELATSLSIERVERTQRTENVPSKSAAASQRIIGFRRRGASATWFISWISAPRVPIQRQTWQLVDNCGYRLEVPTLGKPDRMIDGVPKHTLFGSLTSGRRDRSGDNTYELVLTHP